MVLFLAKCYTNANCSLISTSLRTAEPQVQFSITTGDCRYLEPCLQKLLVSLVHKPFPCVSAHCSFTSMRVLQPTLQKLGIQLSKHKVAAITREEKDVSAQLLYRIKSALATVNSSIAHGQGLNTSKLAATFGVKTELSKGLIEAQQFR